MEKEIKDKILWLPVELLDDYPGGHVFGIDDGDIQKLVASIKSCGKILEPLTVIPDGHRYIIVAGHHRRTAARILGHDTVPCRLLPDGVDPDEAFLATNLVRRDKTPMQIARAVRYWKEKKGIRRGGNRQEKSNGDDCRLDELSKVFGISERMLRTYDKLNDLIPKLQELVDARIIGLSLGEHLATHSPELQRSLYEALGEEIGKIPLKEVKKLKEETDRGYLVLEVLQKKLSDLENHITERAEKEGEIDELEKRVSQLKAKIRYLNHDIIDRQNAVKAQEEQQKKSGAVLLSMMEQVARPVAKAKPEIEALLMNHQVEPNAATHLLKWAQALTEVGQMVEAAVKKVIIFPVKKPQKKEMA
jgi:ParB family chromosome partitioning protein